MNGDYYCHPNVYEEVMRVVDQLDEGRSTPLGLGPVRLIPNPAMPIHPTRWKFPNSAVIEHEPSDEPWCRYFGIGREVEDKSKFMFMQVEPPCFEPAGWWMETPKDPEPFVYARIWSRF